VTTARCGSHQTNALPITPAPDDEDFRIIVRAWIVGDSSLKLLTSGPPLPKEARRVLTTGADSSLIATIADRPACGTAVGK